MNKMELKDFIKFLALLCLWPFFSGAWFVSITTGNYPLWTRQEWREYYDNC